MINNNLEKYISLLNHPTLSLPFNQKSEKSSYFPNFVKKYLDSFLNLLNEKLHGKISAILKKNVKNQIKKINQIINYYFNGNIPAAFSKFEKYFAEIEVNLEKLYPYYNLMNRYLSRLDNIQAKERKLKDLFRGRRSLESMNEITSKEDMYHPPFSHRYNLRNERYSITGYPSLYLGESAYICWVELGKPNFDEFSVARYRFRKDYFTFIDLSWRPQTIAYLILYIKEKYDCNDHELIEFISNFLIMWPLLFMCSIEVPKKHSEYLFHPEYIFPQFLLQFLIVKKRKQEGICYFSMKREYNSPHLGFSYIYGDRLSLNYVIPIHDTEKKGFSKIIQKKIQVSLPTSSQRLQILENHQYHYRTLWPNSHQISFENMRSIEYKRTLFGKIELETYNSEVKLRTECFYLHNIGKYLNENEWIGLIEEKGGRSEDLNEHVVNYIIANDASQLLELNKILAPKGCSIEMNRNNEVLMKWPKVEEKTAIIYTEQEALMKLFDMDFFFD
jgi:hypothetical protein